MELIEGHFAPELADGYRCGRKQCLAVGLARVNKTVVTWPRVLIVHIKRFAAVGGRMRKADRDIFFEEMLEVSGATYSLQSLVQHVGDSFDQGHYNACVRDCRDQWLLLDDSKLPQAVLFDDVRLLQPYLLVFQLVAD